MLRQVLIDVELEARRLDGVEEDVILTPELIPLGDEFIIEVGHGKRIEDVRLQGIASDSTGKRAVIINGEMVKEGEGGGRLRVKKILRNEVVLVIDNEEYRLSIYGEENK